jgi:translation initiation factor 1A
MTRKQERRRAKDVKSGHGLDSVPFRAEGQMYARVTRNLGDRRVRAVCDDGRERTCRKPGSMKERLAVDNVLLVTERVGLAGDTVDVAYKYTDNEVQYLRRVGEPLAGLLQVHVDGHGDDGGHGDDHEVVFEDI